MFTDIQPTTLIQMFCEFMINFEVIFRSVQGPDDTFQGESPSINELKCWIVDLYV